MKEEEEELDSSMEEEEDDDDDENGDEDEEDEEFKIDKTNPKTGKGGKKKNINKKRNKKSKEGKNTEKPSETKHSLSLEHRQLLLNYYNEEAIRGDIGWSEKLNDGRSAHDVCIDFLSSLLIIDY